MQTLKHFFPTLGTTALLLAVGGWASTVQAFTITGTSALFDNVELSNGNLVTTDNPYDKVQFLNDVNGTGENQVRWGSAVYGTETTHQEWVNETTTTSYVGWWQIHDEDLNGYMYDYLAHNSDASATCVDYWYGNICDKYKVTQTHEGQFTNNLSWNGVDLWGTSYSDTSYLNEWTETIITYENQSGLGFAGVESLEISTGESFKVGTLKHFNETIWADNLDGLKSGFELLLDLGEEIGAKTFNFDLHIDETINDASYHANGVCPYETEPGNECSDQITWEFALQEAQTFTKDGEEYTLELVGFSPDEMNAANITQAFISQEDGTSEASLWAKIVKVEQPTENVPEPAGLLGLSLLGAYVVKSRRRQQQVEMAAA